MKEFIIKMKRFDLWFIAFSVLISVVAVGYSFDVFNDRIERMEKSIFVHIDNRMIHMAHKKAWWQLW